MMASIDRDLTLLQRVRVVERHDQQRLVAASVVSRVAGSDGVMPLGEQGAERHPDQARSSSDESPHADAS